MICRSIGSINLIIDPSLFTMSREKEKEREIERKERGKKIGRGE